jgi:hypothetical protein
MRDMKDVMILKDGSYRYKNVKLVDVYNETFPTMVMVDKGPERMKPLIGRKYVTINKAISAIDILQAESLIGKGLRAVSDELAELGFTSPDASVLTDGFKECNPAIMAVEYGA